MDNPILLMQNYVKKLEIEQQKTLKEIATLQRKNETLYEIKVDLKYMLDKLREEAPQ